MPPWTHSPVRVVRRRQHGCACSPWRPHPRPPGRAEAIGQTGNYGRARHDRPDETHALHRAPLLRFFVPSAHSATSRCSGQPARHDPASAFFSPVRFFAHSAVNGAELEMADVRGGSFDHCSMIEKTRVPSSSACRAGETGETDRHAHRRPCHAKRHRFNRAVRSRHAPARPLAWCSATPIRLPRPCRTKRSSFL